MNRRTLFGMVVGAPLARLWGRSWSWTPHWLHLRSKAPTVVNYGGIDRNLAREAEWTNHAAHLALHEKALEGLDLDHSFWGTSSIERYLPEQLAKNRRMSKKVDARFKELTDD